MTIAPIAPRSRIVGVSDDAAIGRIELRHLRHFVAVAEELHFGRAATRLRIAQPALSQSVIALEKGVGVRLLERTTRTVRLTAAGRVFLDESRRVLTQVAQAIDSARQAERGEAGLLRIGYVVSASYELLPPVLVEYRQRSPAVALHLMGRSAAEQVDMLVDGDLSIGFVRESSEHPDLDSELLFDEKLVAVLPTSHPGAERRSTRLSLLADDRFLLFDRSRAPGMYDKIVSSCVAAGFTPQIIQQDSDVQSVLGLVAGGLGVTIVPASFRHLAIEGLTYRPLTDVSTTVALSVVWNRRLRTSVMDGFLDVAREVAAGRRPRASRTVTS
jgi:DNA-binding transcriptional LysR family regulator